MFSKIRLLRLTAIEETQNPCLGILLVPSTRPLVTLELPWFQNTQRISRIPTGIYQAKRTISPKFGITFQVQDVPGRENILFHWGNVRADTEGCILIGSHFVGNAFIAASLMAFKEFMGALHSVDEVTLSIERWQNTEPLTEVR